MRKAADLLRKQIVRVDTGNIIGNIHDLLLDPEQDRLVALITSPGGWLRETTLVPWDAIVVSTGDVILVQPGTEPHAAKDIPQFKDLLDRNIHVSGTAVMSTSGEKIGTVGELLIDDDGRIQGYAISRGFLGAERQFVAASDVEALGADALIVQPNSLRDHLAPLAEPEQSITGRLMTPFGAAVPVESEPLSTEVAPVEDGEPLPATGETIVLDRNAGVPSAGTAESTFIVPPEPAEHLAEASDQPESKLSPAEIDAIVRGDAPMPDPEERRAEG